MEINYNHNSSVVMEELKKNKMNFDDALMLHYTLNTIKRNIQTKNYYDAFENIDILYNQWKDYTSKWNLYELDIMFVSDIMHNLTYYLNSKKQDELKMVYDTIKVVRKIIKNELNYYKKSA